MFSHIKLTNSCLYQLEQNISMIENCSGFIYSMMNRNKGLKSNQLPSHEIYLLYQTWNRILSKKLYTNTEWWRGLRAKEITYGLCLWEVSKCSVRCQMIVINCQKRFKLTQIHEMRDRLILPSSFVYMSQIFQDFSPELRLSLLYFFALQLKI